jgi:hypothetical protein
VGVRSVKDLLLLLFVRASSEEDAVPGFVTETGNAADAGDRRLLEVGLAAGAGFRAAAAASTVAVLCEGEERTAVLFADVTAPAGCC